MSEDKMKKIIYGTAAACLVLLASSVYLLFSVHRLESRGSAKIGYVKSDMLLSQYKPAMAVQQRIQQESADAQKDLESRYKELQGMDADLKKKSEVLTTLAMAPQIEKFQKKQNEFYQLQQSLQQAMTQKQSQLLEPIFQDISTFISKYGKDNGYTVILGTPVEGLLVYGNPLSDLTETILNELNAKVPPTIPVPFGGGDTAKKK
jgi:outer membrane protein